MSEPHTIALIVDPEYGERIRAVISRAFGTRGS